jgi:hypothetical protein
MGVTTSIYDAARTTAALIKSYLGGDERVDSEPIHDLTRDIDAGSWNVIVSGLAEVAKRTRPGNLVRLPFYIASATASLSASQLQAFGPDAARTSVAAWLGGSIVGIVARCENALTAGTATLTASVGGVAGTFSAALSSAAQIGRARQLPGVQTFNWGDLLGLQLTTDGSFAAGSTPSIWGDLIVSYGEEEAV